MTKKITSYQELLDERARLEALFAVQKVAIANGIQEIKDEIRPVRSLLSIAGKFVTRDTSSWLLTAGSNRLIDAVVKRFILSRAGWLTRTIIPFLLKNYSSHLISDNKNKILQKIFSFFSKSQSNGHAKEEQVYS